MQPRRSVHNTGATNGAVSTTAAATATAAAAAAAAAIELVPLPLLSSCLVSDSRVETHDVYACTAAAILEGILSIAVSVVLSVYQSISLAVLQSISLSVLAVLLLISRNMPSEIDG